MIGNIEVDEKKPIEVKASLPTSQAQKDFTSKEVAKLKEMIEKFPGIQEHIEKILKDLKGLNLREMNERISNLFKLTETLATKEVVKEI